MSLFREEPIIDGLYVGEQEEKKDIKLDSCSYATVEIWLCHSLQQISSLKSAHLTPFWTGHSFAREVLFQESVGQWWFFYDWQALPPCTLNKAMLKRCSNALTANLCNPICWMPRHTSFISVHLQLSFLPQCSYLLSIINWNDNVATL